MLSSTKCTCNHATPSQPTEVVSLNAAPNLFITSKHGSLCWFRGMVKCPTKLKCHLSPPVCLLVCVCVCVCVCMRLDWHVLTEHLYTCWLVVNRREMWRSEIFSSTHHMWSHDFDSDLGNRNRGEAPTYVSLVGAGTRSLTLQERRNDIHSVEERGIVDSNSDARVSHLTLRGLISLATISTRSNSNHLKSSLYIRLFH